MTPPKLSFNDDELAFFRLSCDLFTTPESPLRYLDEQAIEPVDPEQTFAALARRGLVSETAGAATPEVSQRLEPVGECSARVVLRYPGKTDSYYLSEGHGVAYRRDGDAHVFGQRHSESELPSMIASGFSTIEEVELPTLNMTPGDYLVFCLFARDVRHRPKQDDDRPMSLDEVLSYFDEDEPEPTEAVDESWQKSVDELCDRGVLVQTQDGHSLHENFHSLAKEIGAERQRSITRFDFFDDQWLVREINLYPTDHTVYRMGTNSDGSVTIQELSAAELKTALEEIICTLPDIMDASSD